MPVKNYRKVKSPFSRPDLKDATKVKHLSERFKRVVGLIHGGFVSDSTELSQILGIDPRDARIVLRQVMRADNQAIQLGIKHGLHPSDSVQLPSQVCCPRCNNRTVVLPCLTCWHRANPNATDPTVRAVKNSDPMEVELSDCIPTQAEPGSLEKIEILRQRYRNKELLHHPEDKKFTPEYKARKEVLGNMLLPFEVKDDPDESE